MNLLPTDWTSFAYGATVTAAIAAFSSGFLKKAGESAFIWVTDRFHSKPKEPAEVERRFNITKYPADKCAWVNEPKRAEYEDKGFFYYPHPKTSGPCYRITYDGRNPFREFLMVDPEAKPLSGA